MIASPFDFSNNMYSGLLTIFAMVMGLTYPVIIDVIKKIDTKYRSSQLNDLFYKEHAYKSFQLSLILSIITGITAPFILYISDNVFFQYVWDVLHTCITIYLITSAITLYNDIMIYYKPKALAERIIETKKKGRNNYLTILADIANYAAEFRQKELYMKCVSEIKSQIAEEIKNKKYEIVLITPKAKEGTFFNFNQSSDIRRALERLLEILCSPNYSNFYTSDSSLIALLFNLMGNTNKRDGYRYIFWLMISETTLANNKEWIMQYWSYAVQQALFDGSNSQSLDGKNNPEESLLKDKEFHIMVCAMLIKYNKGAWLHDIFFYSNAFPYQYPLLCNTFEDIIEFELLFKDQLWKYPWYLSQKYPFKGIYAGVDSDKFILKYVRKILALLFLRLGQIDYNVEHKEPKEPIKVSDSLSENERLKKAVEQLKSDVEDVYAERLNFVVGLGIPNKDEAIKLLESQIDIFNHKIKEIIETPQIDEKKRNNLLLKIDSALKGFLEEQAFPVKEKGELKKHYWVTAGIIIPQDYLLQGYDQFKINSDFTDGIKEVLSINLKLCLGRFFNYNRNKKTYMISYGNVGDALRRLGIKPDYTILCFGFTFFDYFNKGISYPEAKEDNGVWSFNGAQVIDTPIGANPFIIIVRNDELPSLYYEPDVVPPDFKPLKSNQSIYTNIDTLTPDNLNALIAVGISIFYSEPLNSVKISIVDDISNNEYDLKRIEPLSITLGKKQ